MNVDVSGRRRPHDDVAVLAVDAQDIAGIAGAGRGGLCFGEGTGQHRSVEHYR